MNVVLPADPWWLLRVPVEPGESTPFHLWILWAHQFTTPRGMAA